MGGQNDSVARRLRWPNARPPIGGQQIAFRLARADLVQWLAEPMPVILCVYDVTGHAAYWLHIQHYFANLAGFNLFRVGKTVTVHLPVTQIFNPDAVGYIADSIE